MALRCTVFQISADKRPAKRPKLIETFARKAPYPTTGTAKHWDAELKGLVLFTGKRTKTWYFQKNVGGHTKRILIGRYPTISGRRGPQDRARVVI